jgi:adenylate cyclase
LTDADELIRLCENSLVEKTRYIIKHGDHLFEVDEFLGENAGLIIAEVELKSEDEHFEKPSWLGKEVTGDPRYYNSYLSVNPYSGWR